MLPRWNQTWSALPVPAPAPLFERLWAAYSEPHRKYHTVQHLEECFVFYDALPALRGKSPAVELALWFHDVVYDTQSADNEAESAKLAERSLASERLPAELGRRVAELVLLTQHAHRAPADAEGQLLLDVDLSILGAERSRFADYERQIREEYAWVPAPLFQQKRRAILAGFLERPAIYNTQVVHDLLEARARDNLARSLAASE